MSVYDEVLLSVIAMAEEATLYASIIIGPMPPDNGLCMAWGSGAPNEIYLDNGKHTDQQTVSNQLGAIHKNLSRRKWYPQNENFQILDISTSTAPQYVGREENDQWLYGSALRVKFYDRGE